MIRIVAKGVPEFWVTEPGAAAKLKYLHSRRNYMVLLQNCRFDAWIRPNYPLNRTPCASCCVTVRNCNDQGQRAVVRNRLLSPVRNLRHSFPGALNGPRYR